jgi:hypothetical protein
MMWNLSAEKNEIREMIYKFFGEENLQFVGSPKIVQ